MEIEQLARYIVMTCEREGEPVTIARLNFMLYFLRERFGKTFGKELFPGKGIYGPRPSFHSVYMEYKKYGALPIKTHRDEKDWDKEMKCTKKELSPKEFQFVNELITEYRNREMYFLYKEYNDTNLQSWLLS